MWTVIDISAVLAPKSVTHWLFLLTLFLVTIWSASSGSSRCSSPVDTCTVELVDVLTRQNWTTVDALRIEYEDYPIECRHGKDLCKKEFSPDQSRRKGDVTWPETLVGSRRSVRCQFAYTDPVYLSRDCVPVNASDMSEGCQWTDFNSRRELLVCPDPPMSRAIQTLHDLTTNASASQPGGPDNAWCSDIPQQMADIIGIRAKYPSDPVLYTDQRQLYNVVTTWSRHCARIRSFKCSVDDLQRLFSAVNFLFSETFDDYTLSSDTFYSLVDNLTNFLTLRDQIGLARQFNYTSQNIAVSVSAVLPPTGHHETLLSFDDPDQTAVELVATLPRGYERASVRSLAVSHGRTMSRVHVKLIRTDTTDFLLYVQPWEIRGPLVYVDVAAYDEELLANETSLRITFQRSSFSSEPVPETLCVRRHSDRDHADSNWFVADCELMDMTNDTVRCRCNQSRGYFAVVQLRHQRREISFSPFSFDTELTDLSMFLGFETFEYSYHLYIAGQVMRAVSLVCLLATVVTYLVSPTLRRGTTTLILLNLCVSLIVLLVVLYVAEEHGSSRLGCRLSNVFRYYLVLVSLVWNGVEAHNMYRMLIKVFNTSGQSRFVIKAAVVAWGVPAVSVGIALAVDRKAFDGTYLNCFFRCSLRDNTLYYGWLLPMSIIITHNLIVFSLVIRVLCRKELPGAVQSNKKQVSHWTRLCGALTMLVLLGVPWMFSAFGVIDAGQNVHLQNLEGVFNVVFVVGVNLQGLFIFAFHCARRKAIRDSWKSTLTSRWSTHTQSTSGSLSPGTQTTTCGKDNRRQVSSTV